MEYNTFVLSFTRKNDALCMWTRYANSQQNDGYSIAFDDVFAYSCKDYSIELVPVVYNANKQQEIVKEILRYLYMAFNDNDLSKYEKYDRKSIIDDLFGLVVQRICGSFKHEAYKDEGEVRAILHLNNEKLIQHRTSGGIIIPYVPVKIDTNKIKNVTISPAVRYNVALPGIRSLKNDLGLKFEITQSEIPFRIM